MVSLRLKQRKRTVNVCLEHIEFMHLRCPSCLREREYYKNNLDMFSGWDIND